VELKQEKEKKKINGKKGERGGRRRLRGVNRFFHIN
jgi:hypothetical protein